MSKECAVCNRYIPVCRLFGYFDKTGKPKIDRVKDCENRGCDICKKGETK